jgi:hypothetical protein
MQNGYIESFNGKFRDESLNESCLKRYNKYGMRVQSGDMTTTRSDHIAALEEFHLLSPPTFIGDELPVKVNPSIQI